MDKKLVRSLQTETYPSGRVVTTGYDTANRPYTTTGTLGTQQTNYNTQTGYAPQGVVSNYFYHNQVVPAYTYNNRLQPGQNWATLGKVGNTDQSTNDHNNYLLMLIYGWGNNGNLLGAGGGIWECGSIQLVELVLAKLYL